MKIKTYSNSVVIALGFVVHITIKALTKPTSPFLHAFPNLNYKQDYKRQFVIKSLVFVCVLKCHSNP